MNQNVKKYLKNVRLAFPVFRKFEKRFYEDFRATVNEYELLHPQCVISDLINDFGTPQEISAQYFNNMDSDKYLSLMRVARYIRITTYVFCILMIIFFSLQSYSLYKVRKAEMDTIVTTEEIVIKYDEEE